MENKQENKSPSTYSFYDKKYNYSDLRREGDVGLNNYLNQLNIKDKDKEQVRIAYNNLMSGIGDNSISAQDGRLVDSYGRYTNNMYYDSDGTRKTTSKKSKDYYGLAANYIYNIMGKSPEYQNPEDKSKIKWEGSQSIGQALIRNIYNTDRYNVRDFVDLDSQDLTKTSNRAKRLQQAFTDVSNNFDSLFTNYTDSDKQQALAYMQDAINSLGNNQINYLTLSRAANGLDYRQMFSNGQESSKDEGTDQQSTQEAFLRWKQQNYPTYSGDLHSLSLATNEKFGQWTLNTLSKALSSVSDKDLVRMTRSLLSTKGYRFANEQFLSQFFPQGHDSFSNQIGFQYILKTMKDKGLLQPFGEQSPGLYYIPGTSEKGKNVAWVWNENDGSVSQMKYDDIPFLFNKMVEKFRSSTQSLKTGGVIKAQNGASLWDFDLPYFDKSGYESTYNTEKLLNSAYDNQNRDAWVSNVAGMGSGRYNPSTVNTREYATTVEKSPYYSQFTSDILDSEGNFTDVGLKWAKDTDALLPENSTARFFDQDGNLRTSWTVTNKDTYGRAPQTFKTLKDYVLKVRNDQIIGGRHNGYDKVGDRYFYVDSKGQKHWVNPNDIGGYIVTENPVDTSVEGNTTWSDYQLLGLKEDPNKKTNVYGTNLDNKPKDLSNLSNQLRKISPELLGISRLALSLRTNNKVANVIRKSLNPVLRNTYERYSPVTGAFSQMQMLNGQAADLRQQVSRPFTSDATLQLNAQLEAGKQARALEQQGFLADDKNIQMTKQAALERQEDNMKRRSDVADFNRASINQTNREKSQLEATRLKQNWQSVDNYLQGVESRLRSNYLQDLDRRNNFRLQTSLADIDSRYQDAISNATNMVNAWTRDPRNSGKTLNQMEGYNTYINFMRAMNNWKNAQVYKTHANIYGYNYDNPALYQTPESIRGHYGYRNGGTLSLRSKYLINKIIRNENNS